MEIGKGQSYEMLTSYYDGFFGNNHGGETLRSIHCIRVVT